MTETPQPGATTVPCRIVRGGTSKGVFFHERDLPADPDDRDRLLMRVMGSPDARQIDGLGGADPLTSKIAVIGDGAAFGADVTYTFAAMGIDQPYVNYSANCGNLTAAAALFAVETGLVEVQAPETRIDIYNTNSERHILVDVPIAPDGHPQIEGDFVNPGVPGTGAEIRLDFAKTVGSTTPKLLPTGSVRDRLYVPGLGIDVDVSIVDIGKIACFFRAEDVGVTGAESPTGFDRAVLDRFWAVREAAADFVGIDRSNGHLPTPIAVAPPRDYVDFVSGRTIAADEMTLCARRVIGPPARLHKAFAGTGAVCTAVAANLAGSTVNEVVASGSLNPIRIGHPSGVFPVVVQVSADHEVLQAGFSRSARTLMAGEANRGAHWML